jgi:O-antigen ligase
MNSIVWKVKSSGTEMFMSIRDAYLVFGMQLGILFLLLLFYQKNILLKILTFGLLVATGARGPLVMMILVTMLYQLSRNKISSLNPKIILNSIFVAVALFMTYFLYSNKLDALLANTFKRFGSLLGGEDASALERVYRLKFAFNQPFEKLSTFFFGNGNGSFGILYEKIDQRSYPHNVLVECFFELGSIGLVIFLLLFLSIFRKISFKENVFGMLFLFAFLNAMKSSGITDLWILFSVMGALVAMKAQLETSEDALA